MATRPRPIRQFRKGQTIIREGSIGDCSFKILQGEVVICKQNPHGNLIPMAKLGPGELFGEMYLFEENATRTASAIAISDDVSVEIYSENEMSQMMTTLSLSTRDIFQGLSQRLKRISNNYAQMTKASSAPAKGSQHTPGFITRNPKPPQS